MMKVALGGSPVHILNDYIVFILDAYKNNILAGNCRDRQLILMAYISFLHIRNQAIYVCIYELFTFLCNL